MPGTQSDNHKTTASDRLRSIGVLTFRYTFCLRHALRSLLATYDPLARDEVPLYVPRGPRGVVRSFAPSGSREC